MKLVDHFQVLLHFVVALDIQSFCETREYSFIKPSNIRQGHNSYHHKGNPCLFLWSGWYLCFGSILWSALRQQDPFAEWSPGCFTPLEQVAVASWKVVNSQGLCRSITRPSAGIPCGSMLSASGTVNLQQRSSNVGEETGQKSWWFVFSFWKPTGKLVTSSLPNKLWCSDLQTDFIWAGIPTERHIEVPAQTWLWQQPLCGSIPLALHPVPQPAKPGCISLLHALAPLRHCSALLRTSCVHSFAQVIPASWN